MQLIDDAESKKPASPIITSFTFPGATPGGFRNYTNLIVPREAETLLSWGPRFVTRNTKVTRVVCLAADDTPADNEETDVYYRNILTQLCGSFCAELRGGNENSPMSQKISHMIKATHTFLKTHTETCLMQSDKSKCTILVYKDDYRRNMRTMVNSNVAKGVYMVFEGDFVAMRHSIRRRYNDLVTRLKTVYESSKETPFSNELFMQLCEYGKDEYNIELSYLYGILKCHKPDQPCRSICASQHWYSYPVGKIISVVLKQTLGQRFHSHNVCNVNDLAVSLQKMSLCDGYVFVKYDIKDMFTCINKNDVVNMLTNIFSRQWFYENCALPIDILKECLDFTLNGANYLSYNGQIYYQLLGLPQGSPESGILAKVWLDYALQMYNKELFENHMVAFWWKNVDDFLLYIPENNIDIFKNKFEMITNLQLTVERETTGNGIMSAYPTLSYLDLQITRVARRVFINQYKRPDASMRMLNYLSQHSYDVKLNAATGELFKIVRRTSTPYLISDLSFLEQKLKDNNYPELFIREFFIKEITKEANILI